MKRLLIIGTILVDISAASIIPINLFWLSMPEFISIILSVFIIILNVFVWIKIRNKIPGKIVLTIFSMFIVLCSLFGTYCNPYWNSVSMRENVSYYSKPYNYVLSYEEAIKDLDYAMKYLKKVHPVCYHGVPKNMKLQYDIVKDNLKKADTITVSILGREIESIFSLLGDAHTYVSAYYAEPHFLKYINVHNEAGDDLTKINGICIEDLFKSKSGYYSYEREDCGIAAFYQDISMLEGMTYLGFNLDDGVEYTYESEDGKEITHTVYSDDFLNWNDYMSYNNLEENSNTDKSFVRYEVDKEHNLAVLYLDECKNNKEYRKVLKKMFTEVKEKNILNVAVDLRFNGGGDSSVATEFIRYLNEEEYKEWADIWRLGIFKFKNSAHTEKNKKINHLLFDGNVYILTSKDTFSSAMDFAMYIKDNHFGTVIGEASGNNPNSYGMISSFKLPNSELYMQISTKKWYRLDTETTDTFIEPDIKCDSQDALEEVYKICSQEE